MMARIERHDACVISLAIRNLSFLYLRRGLRVRCTLFLSETTDARASEVGNPVVTQSWIRGGCSNPPPSPPPSRPRRVLRLGRARVGTKLGRLGQEARRESEGWGRGGAPRRRSALPDSSPQPSIRPADTRSRGHFLKGYTLRFVSGPGVAGKRVDGWPTLPESSIACARDHRGTEDIGPQFLPLQSLSIGH